MKEQLTVYEQTVYESLLAMQTNFKSHFDRNPLSEDDINHWLRMLKNYQPKVISKAFEQYLSKGKFPPVPADILEIARPLRDVEDKLARRSQDEEPKRDSPEQKAKFAQSKKVLDRLMAMADSKDEKQKFHIPLKETIVDKVTGNTITLTRDAHGNDWAYIHPRETRLGR